MRDNSFDSGENLKEMEREVSFYLCFNFRLVYRLCDRGWIKDDRIKVMCRGLWERLRYLREMRSCSKQSTLYSEHRRSEILRLLWAEFCFLQIDLLVVKNCDVFLLTIYKDYETAVILFFFSEYRTHFVYKLNLDRTYMHTLHVGYLLFC